MADYTRREFTVRTVEYAVPCRLPWGAAWAEVQMAIDAALVDYREKHDLREDARPADDWLRIFPGDDEILIRFEVKAAKL